MNTVTESQLDTLLALSQTEEATFWGKEHVVSYRLPNGFSVIGRAACVDPANFDIEKGRYYARLDVKRQLWQLEGYLLQHNLFVNSEPAYDD